MISIIIIPPEPLLCNMCKIFVYPSCAFFCHSALEQTQSSLRGLLQIHIVVEPRSAVTSARSLLAAGVLRINHYKPGKRLQEAIRDESVMPLGLAIQEEIQRMYGRPSDEMVDPLRSTIQQTQAHKSNTKGGSCSSSKAKSSKGKKGSEGPQGSKTKRWWWGQRGKNKK
jgi:hypothetical protein